MNTTELIEIARECGANITWIPGAEKQAVVFFVDELQQFVQRIEQSHLQRIAELTQRADKVADSLEQAEKRLTVIASKASAILDTKDAQIAQLRESLEDVLWDQTHENMEKARKALEESQ